MQMQKKTKLAVFHSLNKTTVNKRDGFEAHYIITVKMTFIVLQDASKSILS